MPPLRYETVHQLTKDFPALRFSVNGGFTSVAAIQEQLASHALQGVMVGRRACESPSFLAEIGANLFFFFDAAYRCRQNVLWHRHNVDDSLCTAIGIRILLYVHAQQG